jgi:hypothetical protein
VLSPIGSSARVSCDCSLSFPSGPDPDGCIAMAWWYEVRDADNRLMELKRGFATEREAVEAGQRAKKMIQSIVSQIEAERLAVVTGPDAPE